MTIKLTKSYPRKFLKPMKIWTKGGGSRGRGYDQFAVHIPLSVLFAAGIEPGEYVRFTVVERGRILIEVVS